MPRMTMISCDRCHERITTGQRLAARITRGALPGKAPTRGRRAGNDAFLDLCAACRQLLCDWLEEPRAARRRQEARP